MMNDLARLGIHQQRSSKLTFLYTTY